MRYAAAAVLLFLSSTAWAGSAAVEAASTAHPASPQPTASPPPLPCPPEVTESGGTCLTKEQREKIVEALKELDDIHRSKAELEFPEPIVIVRDWEDRVYVNGGERKPVKVKLRIGGHVDRDLEARLPVRVFYREKPPDPWFRLRIRAQFGILVPQLVRSVRNAASDASPERDGGLEEFWDAGIGWDFFHVPDWGLNLAAYTGIRSLGGGLGMDLTKNFGLYAGYGVTYDGWDHSLLTSAYFAFN